jgi:hypothetical protein
MPSLFQLVAVVVATQTPRAMQILRAEFLGQTLGVVSPSWLQKRGEETDTLPFWVNEMPLLTRDAILDRLLAPGAEDAAETAAIVRKFIADGLIVQSDPGAGWVLTEKGNAALAKAKTPPRKLT